MEMRAESPNRFGEEMLGGPSALARGRARFLGRCQALPQVSRPIIPPKQCLLTSLVKVTIGKGQILLPIIIGHIVFPCPNMIANPIPDRMIDRRHFLNH